MSEVNVPIDPQKSNLIEEDQFSKMVLHPGKYRTLACLALLALVLIAAFFLQGFSIILMGALGLFATIGIFAVLAYSAGIVELNGRQENVNIFSAYTDQLAEGILITNKKGEVTYANQAYSHIIGQAHAGASQIVNRLPTVETYFSGDPSIAEPLYRLCQAAAQNRIWEDEFAIIQPLDSQQILDEDQVSTRPSIKWLRISVRPIQLNGPKDSTESTVWRLQDVTLERSEKDHEYNNLNIAVQQFDQAPMGFFTLNVDGEVTYMNGTMAGWLGFDDTTRAKLNITSIMSLEGVQLLQQTLTPYSQLRSVQYYDLIAQDGSTISTILYGRPMSMDQDELKSSDQAHFGVVAFQADDAPLLFEPQRMTEMRLEQFYHSAPIGIATINGNGEISNANGSFRVLLGQAANETAQTNILFECIAKEYSEDLLAALKKANEGSAFIEPVDVEFILGDKRSGRLFLSPARDMAEDGAVAIIYAIDTSQQRALEEQFAQSQKMQAVGQLAGGIAHDFNNVLTAIIGYCDLLIGSHRPTDPAFKDMMHIKQNANRAASLVRQLLAFSRQQTLRPEVLSLNDVIQDVTAMLSRLLGERIDLEVEYGRDLWSVKADHHQFDQVIINLAVNARDAMSGSGKIGMSGSGKDSMISGGKLTLRTENIAEHSSLDEEKRGLPSGEYVRLEISDTGTGMPQDVIDKIFEPFFTTKDIGKGTGLGLSMVYGIVKQTDGYIFVDSTPGEGTSFKVYLPRHIEESQPQIAKANEEKKAEVPKDLTGSECVLLVEDEEAVRSFAVRALTTRGYKVLEASSGLHALDVVADHEGSIDLVISDVMMPEMDGPTMLSNLRDRLPDVKVIFISGYAEDAFEKNLEKGEHFTFLPKPFSLKQLAATVKDVLESSS